MRRIFHWMLAGITLMGLIFRLDGVDDEGLWHDEAVCWRDVDASWPNFIDTLLIGECNPPLYFALLKVWTGLVGESTLALRLPSVVFGTLTIPLLGLFVARLAGPGAACLAAFFLAISPFHIGYSQEARPYTFFPFIVLASTVALTWALETGNMAVWAKRDKWLQSPLVLFAFYGLLALFAINSDYSYAIHPLCALTAMAVLFWALERWQGNRPGQLEIYAVLAILAFRSRDYYYSSPILVLVVAFAVLCGVEFALEMWKGGKSNWRSLVYAFLGILAFLTQYLTFEFPFFVLGATAVLFWALQIRQHTRREGGQEIYAFLVMVAFCIHFHSDMEPFLILAATVPMCWILEKWQRRTSRRQETNPSKAAVHIARELVPALPARGRPLSPSPRLRYAVYTVLALLACYTHYFSAFFIAAQGVFVALVSWKERRLRPVFNWILCMVAVGSCFLVWLPYMVRFNLVRPTQWVAYVNRDWSPLMQMWVNVKNLIFGGVYPMWHGNAFPDAFLILTPLVVWLAYRCLQTGGSGQEPRGQESQGGSQTSGVENQHAGVESSSTRKSSFLADDCRPVTPDAFAFALLGVMTVVPLLVAWTLSQYRPILVARYVIPIVPAAMGLLALTIWRMRWRVLRVLLAVALGLYLFENMLLQQSKPARPYLNMAAAYIGAHLKPGDGIVVEPAEVHLVLKYYLRERTPPLVNDYHFTDHPDPEQRPLPADLAARLEPFKRVWLVREGDNLPYPIERYLVEHYTEAGPQQSYEGVGAVRLFIPRRD